MRKSDRNTAGGRAPPFTVERGDWKRFEPDAIDALERLTAAFKAGLEQGRTPDPARVRERLAGIGRAAEAVEAAQAGLAAALQRGGRT